jgi:plasmid stability protein
MATVTLKNIPDELYERLKATAQAHRRSINSELIYCLETVLKPRKISAEERLARLRRVRPQVDPNAVGLDEIQQAIDQGRP